MDREEFVKDKRIAFAKLNRALLAGGPTMRLQPPVEDGFDELDEPIRTPTAVYLTSVRNSEKGTTAGKVSAVPVGFRKPNGEIESLAAQRIAEGTHIVSTSEEIEAWMREQAAQHVLHSKLDAKRDDKRRGRPVGEDLNPLPEHLQEFAGPPAKPQRKPKSAVEEPVEDKDKAKAKA